MTSTRTPDLSAKPYPHWMPVIEEICDRHGVAWREVLAGYRDRRVTACRHAIWATLYDRFRSSFATIGRRTGGYHHTTVMDGAAKHRGAAP